MKNTIILILLLIALSANTQPIISVGTGLVSSGQWVSSIESANLICGQWGLGIKSIDQDVADCPGNLTAVCELHEWSIRLLYTSPTCERISLFVGAGQFRSEYFVNLDGHYRSERTIKGNCAEIGFGYRVIDGRRFCSCLTASIDSYSKVNTMITLGLKLNHE